MTVALVLGTVTLVGVNRDQFVVVPASNPRDGRTLATGQRCTVAVGFKPTTAGLESRRSGFRRTIPTRRS